MAEPDAVVQKTMEEKKKGGGVEKGVQDLTKTRKALMALESFSSQGLSQASTSEVNDVWILDLLKIEGNN